MSRLHDEIVRASQGFPEYYELLDYWPSSEGMRYAFIHKMCKGIGEALAEVGRIQKELKATKEEGSA